MKKSYFIFVLLFFIVVGYASVNAVLDIKGNIKVSENIEDFKIEITNLSINNSDSKNLISKDKHSFTFTGTSNDNINYTVTNYSYQYDANITLICNPSDNITIEQINTLSAQDRITKTITSKRNDEVTCTINIEKISRIEYAEDICVQSIGQVWEFNYTGSEQVFNVPCDGEYKIELWGARGGNIKNYFGGLGAYTLGNIKLIENIKMYLYIGGFGSDNSIDAGYNGGGKMPGVQLINGRTGGGSTDIRIKNGAWNNFDSLMSRIMVAAGGGGANFRSEGYGEGNGGSGGGLIGYSGITVNSVNSYGHGIATGASQISAGRYSWTGTSSNPGTPKSDFGIGGGSTEAPIQGGGGSGYYGGSGNIHGGGAGGSSFISGHSGCDAISESSTSSKIIHTGQPNHYSGYVFTNTIMVDGAGYNWTTKKESYTGMPTYDGKSTMTGNSGNGYAKITYLGN